MTIEKEYFDTYYIETNQAMAPYRSLYKHNSDTVMTLWMDYQEIIKKENVPKLKSKLKMLIRYGIYSLSFYKNSSDRVIGLFQKLYYERKISELKEQINALTRSLEGYQFDSVIKEYSANSMKLFKDRLAGRYSFNKGRVIFTKDSLWKDNEFGSFVMVKRLARGNSRVQLMHLSAETQYGI